MRWLIFANSVDPDEMAHNEPSHLDLHCLQKYLLLFARLIGLSIFSKDRDFKITKGSVSVPMQLLFEFVGGSKIGLSIYLCYISFRGSIFLKNRHCFPRKF